MPPFDDEAVIAAQLASLGASEAQFVAALGARGDALAEAVRRADPLWCVDADAEVHAAMPTAPDASGLRTVVDPLIGVAHRELAARITELVRGRASLPFDPDTIDTLFDDQLRRRLLGMLSRTLVLELHLARLDSRLDGATPEARFRSFVQTLHDRGTLRRLLAEYPVLARRLGRCAQQWVETNAELLERLIGDIDDLRVALVSEEPPGPLCAVSGDLGDYHGNGRSVRVLRFASGARIVYKPRSLGVARHWNALLEWANEHGFTPGFRTVRLVDRDEYGWMGFVEMRACASPQEIRHFYERQGGYLAFLHLLGATDFHHENVIAAGDHPVLIDLEGLLGAAIPARELARHDGIVETALAYSVLRTGLLPVPWGHISDETGDLSGLGAMDGRPSPYAAAQWDDAGTDAMRFVRRPLAMRGVHNRPMLNGEPVELLPQVNAIVDGFRRAYRMLLVHRDALLAEDSPLRAFADDEVRVILRFTRTYAVLLEEAMHPDVLRDALDCDWLFSRLWLSVADQPALARVIRAEERALWRGDVPRFVTRAGTRDVWTCSGDRISAFLSESCLDGVHRRLAELAPHDLERQAWLIRASLVTECSGLGIHRVKRPLPSLAEAVDPDPSALIEAAGAIGDRLETLAVRNDNGDVAWMGLRLEGNTRWSVAALGPELYDGTAGVTLFLAYLAHVSGQDRYAALARAALGTLRKQLTAAPGMRTIGAFDGLGGIVYVLSHLAALWERSDLMLEASEFLTAIDRQIEDDANFDVISGAAGAIAALASFAAVHPEGQATDVARRCGDHLIAHATQMTRGVGWMNADLGTRPLAGFSHGAGGIAWALSLLATWTGYERYRDVARLGVEYERSLFHPIRRNWPDLRDGGSAATSPGRPEAFLTAWCHGAAGIALARVHMRECLGDVVTRSEIETAIATTIAEGFGDNHSLCHGDLGNLDILMQVGDRLPSASLVDARRQATALLIRSLRRDEWLCGIPLAVESPGLMTGLAGIGYGLLRLAAPHRVPSVLALGVPSQGDG